MATTYKVLGQVNPSATTATTLYTVPAANSAIISTLNICNLNSSAASFRIAVRPAGTTLANVHYLAYDTVVPANNSISYTIGMSLATTDVVTVYANTALVSFSLFGTEIN
jgi:hypothetical protein